MPCAKVMDAGIPVRFISLTAISLYWSIYIKVAVFCANELRGIVKKKTNVESVILNDVEYKWTMENDDAIKSIYKIAIYEWKQELNAYTRIRESDSRWAQLYNAVNLLK